MGNDDHEDDDYETATLTDVKKAAVFGALDGVLTSFAVVAGAAGVLCVCRGVLCVWGPREDSKTSTSECMRYYRATTKEEGEEYGTR